MDPFDDLRLISSCVDERGMRFKATLSDPLAFSRISISSLDLT